jgi:hypothetical protein
MLSAIIASVLSMSSIGSSAVLGAHVLPPHTTKENVSSMTAAQYSEMTRIDETCRAKGIPTLYEKLTASTQPRLRLIICLQKNMAASPALAGWQAFPIQAKAKK